MTMPLAVVESSRSSDVDEIDHLYCCDPDRSLCGLDLTTVPEVDDLPNLCVVCEDLNSHDCPCDCGCCTSGRVAP